MSRRTPAPLCPYCGCTSTMITGDLLYPRRPDLKAKRFYTCKPCDASVGCHPGTDKPLGRLANKTLRLAKTQAHLAFDPLWQAKMEREGVSKKDARNAAYAWLADQMGLKAPLCHIGMFNEEQCQRVVALCSVYHKGKGNGQTPTT